MGLETSVTQISDLNAAWPLGSDTKNYGDEHLRNIKVALKSILTNPSQIPGWGGGGGGGSVVEEHTLAAASTAITTSTTAAAGIRLTKVIIQDATGGRAITWDTAKFVSPTVTLSTAANAVNIFDFIGRSDGKFWLVSPPILGL